MLNAQSSLKNQKLTFLPACAAWVAEEAEAPDPSAATAAAADEAVAGYPEEAAAADAYLAKVHAAGGWKRYAQAHAARLAPIFAKVFPHAARLPPELVAHIVDLWAHVGYY